MSIHRKILLNEIPEGYRDMMACPQPEEEQISSWLCPERFLLPLWPEFALRIRWGDSDFVEHSNSILCSLEFPEQGNLRLTQRGVSTVIGPGQAGILHRGEDSRLEVGPAGFCRKRSLGIRGSALTSVLAAAGLLGRQFVPVRQLAVVLGLVEQIMEKLRNKEYSQCPRISALVMEIIGHLALAGSEIPDERLALALNLFAINIPNRVTVAAIAERLHISKMTLERMFRLHVGKSPGAYFLELKMRTAESLLCGDRSMAIQQVADRVGYSDALAFSREFRKYSGYSPSAYRELSGLKS